MVKGRISTASMPVAASSSSFSVSGVMSGWLDSGRMMRAGWGSKVMATEGMPSERARATTSVMTH